MFVRVKFKLILYSICRCEWNWVASFGWCVSVICSRRANNSGLRGKYQSMRNRRRHRSQENNEFYFYTKYFVDCQTTSRINSRSFLRFLFILRSSNIFTTKNDVIASTCCLWSMVRHSNSVISIRCFSTSRGFVVVGGLCDHRALIRQKSAFECYFCCIQTQTKNKHQICFEWVNLYD